MRQSTRGDVQWSGSTSDPRGGRFRNFVRPPSGTASALVWHLTLRTALRSSHQSIRRDRVSGCPAWSEGHSFYVETTMTHPPCPAGENLRKAAAPPRACAARLHMRAADLMCAVCRCNRTWLLLHHVFGIVKTRRRNGRRCAATIVG